MVKVVTETMIPILKFGDSDASFDSSMFVELTELLTTGDKGVGATDGVKIGNNEGLMDGTEDIVGLNEGLTEGENVGFLEGLADGVNVGIIDGVKLGT